MAEIARLNGHREWIDLDGDQTRRFAFLLQD
jgi:hypothetical protein